MSVLWVLIWPRRPYEGRAPHSAWQKCRVLERQPAINAQPTMRQPMPERPHAKDVSAYT